ncbi:MAG: hypothetical protein WCC36_06050 [Gammaproteobacteria bacterium]
MHRAAAILMGLVSLAPFALQSASAAQGITSRHAPAAEVMLLPKFCWGQYFNYSQPQYHINNCGPGINHYCQGLIFLNIGERTFDNMRKKRSMLKRAKSTFHYTQRWIKQFPNCPIRGHVAASMRRVDMDLNILPKK